MTDRQCVNRWFMGQVNIHLDRLLVARRIPDNRPRKSVARSAGWHLSNLVDPSSVHKQSSINYKSSSKPPRVPHEAPRCEDEPCVSGIYDAELDLHLGAW